MDLNKIKKAYLIGVGGIGISALGRMFLSEGKQVSGSDISKSEIIKELEDLGTTIFIGQRAENLDKNIDLVIYSPAIDESNSELIKAKELNIPTLSYPQALGLFSQNYSLIAVSGTHGKTTTTAMAAKVLIEANLDPTVVVGSLLKKPKTNYIKGDGKYLVIEACEYKRSFLNFKPHILIITNIDLDHLDYYKDLKDIQSAFIELASKLSKDDYLICDVNHKNLEPIINAVDCKIIDFKAISENGLDLKIPGKHNIENAQNVLALADILKLNKQKTINSLNSFEGTWRRFEYKGKTKDSVKIYDDYAHNPTEVLTTLKGFRDLFLNEKIIVVFQPHLYSRTKIFLDQFALSFGDVDNVIVLPIYASRENFDSSINSEMLVGRIKKYHKNVVFAPDFNLAIKEINKIEDKDIVITMSAGDVYKVGEMLLKE